MTTNLNSEVMNGDFHKVVIQITDTHITAEGNLHGTVDSLDGLTEILSVIANEAKAPDLLLFTGDLADKGEPEAYRRFRSAVEPYAAKMGTPVLYMPGNHDERSAFRSTLLDSDDAMESVDQVIWSDGLRVIALDSTVPGSHYGEIDDAQIAWLKAELETVAPLGTIVALHHPPIPGPCEFLNEIILRDPERLSEALAGTDVKMIIAGHAHHVSGGVLGGIPVWVATASAYQMDVISAASESLRGLAGTAFTRIDVTQAGIVATHIPMMDRSHPLYEIEVATIRRWLAEGANLEEIETAFEPAEAAK